MTADGLGWSEVIRDGLGQLTRPFGTAPVDPAAGARSLAASQARDRRGQPVRHPGPRARGVPRRVRRLGRHRVPGPAVLGRHLRPRAGRGDGRPDRRVDARRGRAPGPRPGARRDPRLPLGPHRGDHRRGPVPRRHRRHGLRPRAGGRRRRRHPQALRRLLGQPRRPQPGTRVDRPARAGRRRSCRRSRWRSATAAPGRSCTPTPSSTGCRRPPTPACSPRCCATRGASPARSSRTTSASGSCRRCTASAGSEAEAAALALAAGVDVELPSVHCYGEPLRDALARGEVDEALVDRALRRVLTQKAELGLLDAGLVARRPTPSPVLDDEQSRDLALRLAREAIVLLSNRDRRPAAAARRAGRPRRPARRRPDGDARLLLVPRARRRAPPGGTGWASRSRPCSTRCAPPGSTSPTPAAATSPTTTATGSPRPSPPRGTPTCASSRSATGPACSAAARPARAATPPTCACRASRPTWSARCSPRARRWSCVLLTGRPYALGPLADDAAAVVQAFFPGQLGGQALAEVLTGTVNPSGRLPVSIPADASGQPGTYLSAPLGRRSGVSSVDPTAAFPFGHGLSYTSFSWSARATSDEWAVDGDADGRGARHQHGGAGRRRRRAALPARPGGAGDPARRAARRLRPGGAGARRSRRSSRSPSPPTSPRSPGWSGARIVEPGDVELRVARSSADDSDALALRLVGRAPGRSTTRVG